MCACDGDSGISEECEREREEETEERDAWTRDGGVADLGSFRNVLHDNISLKYFAYGTFKILL